MAIRTPLNIKNRKIRLNPSLPDFMFIETHAADSPLMKDPNRAYGDPHKDASKYPDHSLVYVSPERLKKDGRKVVDFYYAAIGENQGAYNFQYQEPTASNGGWAQYTRKYFVKREDVQDYFGACGSAASVQLTLSDTSFTTGEITIGDTTINYVFDSFPSSTNAIFVDSQGWGISTKELLAQNIAAFINGEDPIDSGASNYDPPIFHERNFNEPVTATVEGAVVTIRANDAGVEGNSIGVSTTVDTATFSAPTLEGGEGEVGSPSVDGPHYLPVGAEDPDIEFNPEFCGFEFTAQRVLRVPEAELDGLYVIIERTFEKLCVKESGRLNPQTGGIDPVRETIVPTEDALSAGIDPDTGEYTETQAVNCSFSKEVTATDPTASMNGIPLEAVKYNPATCELEYVTETVVPADEAEGTTPSYDGADDENATSDGSFVEVTPINKLFSKEVTRHDQNWSLLNIPLVRKIIDRFNYTTVNTSQTVRTSTNAAASVPEVVGTGTEATSDGVFTEVTPISSCLSKETEDVDLNWAALNKTLFRKVVDRFKSALVSLAETVRLKDDAQAVKPVITGSGDTATSDGVYTEVTPINDKLSKEEQKIDPNYASINVPLTRKVFSPTDCEMKELTEKVQEKEAAELSAAKPTDSTGIYTEAVAVNAELSKLIEKVDPDWALLNDELEGSVYTPAIKATSDTKREVVQQTSNYEEEGPDSEGNVVEYKPISPCLSLKTTRKIVPADAYWVSMGYNQEFGIPIREVTTFTQTEPTAGVDGEIVKAEQYAEGWWKVTTTDSIDEALENYSLIYPSSAGISVPSVLNAVGIVWNRRSSEGEHDTNWNGVSTGESVSLSGGEAGTAQGSATIQPSLHYDITHGFSGSVPVDVHVFFAKEEDVASKIEALGPRWPLFRPRSAVIALNGQNVTLSVKVSARAHYAASSRSASTDKTEGLGFSVAEGASSTTVTIPPTIHDEIIFDGSPEEEESVTVSARIGWLGWGGFPSADVSHLETATVKGSVSPNSVGATAQTTVPESGIYVLNSRVSPYKNGWVKVAVETFDASTLA